MLSRVIGPFQVKAYLEWIDRARALQADLREDTSFLSAVQRAFLPLPGQQAESISEGDLFPPFRPLAVPQLQGKRIGIVASGGSGATASALGVLRACEEAGLEIGAIAACSGSVLFLSLIAAGLSAQDAVDFVLGWRQRDYLDPQWRQLLSAPFHLGRGFTGLLKAEAIERTYHGRLGGLLVGDTPIPFYANLWDLDHNRVAYPGTTTTPEMRLARLVRAAVSLPVFVQPLEMDGILWGDGGVANIFPVEILLQQHPEIDFFIGINTFYPKDFAGEDLSGWQDRSLGILHLGQQGRFIQHLEAARVQLRLIQDRCLLLHPVPYQEVTGVKFYEQFLDRRRWPQYMVRGYYYTRHHLALLAAQADSMAAQADKVAAQEQRMQCP